MDHSNVTYPLYIQHINKRFLTITTVLLFLCLSDQSLACSELAKTEFERIYCTIVESGNGQNLPNINEFRKNPPTTQRLLLRKPAKKMGIALPAASAQAVKQKKKPIFNPKQDKTVQRAKRKPIERDSHSSISDCNLSRDSIHCGANKYQLALNKKNTQLDQFVFSETNTLILPSRNSPRYRQESKLKYLSSIYPIYINKMIVLGLGDTTMSFTKFAATYEDIEKQKLNFSGRFREMYELLKKEKQRNPIKARYSNDYPEDIDHCMKVSKRLITCDNIKKNWVYQKVSLD